MNTQQNPVTKQAKGNEGRTEAKGKRRPFRRLYEGVASHIRTLKYRRFIKNYDRKALLYLLYADSSKEALRFFESSGDSFVKIEGYHLAAGAYKQAAIRADTKEEQLRLWELAGAYFAQAGIYTGAANAYKDAAKCAPTEEKLRLGKLAGHYHIKAGNPGKGAKTYRETANLYATNNKEKSELYLLAGDAYLEMGDLARATAEYREAIPYAGVDEKESLRSSVTEKLVYIAKNLVRIVEGEDVPETKSLRAIIEYSKNDYGDEEEVKNIEYFIAGNVYREAAWFANDKEASWLFELAGDNYLRFGYAKGMNFAAEAYKAVIQHADTDRKETLRTTVHEMFATEAEKCIDKKNYESAAIAYRKAAEFADKEETKTLLLGMADRLEKRKGGQLGITV